MTVTPSIREVLRLKEGHPHRYAEIEIVVTPFGKQRTVRAFTYIVTHQFALHFDVPVTQEYRRLILEGAASHRLSPPTRGICGVYSERYATSAALRMTR
jgi:hypothetical protein